MQVLFKITVYTALLLVFAEARKKTIIRATRYGKVRGLVSDLAQVFYGVPYAAPPQRWTPPEEPSRWQVTYDARTKKPMCYQPTNCTQDNPLTCIPLKSEDCLYLNIFAPLNTRKNSKKAVIFVVHGGLFEMGTGAGPIYNAEMLAQKGDVIVVTINYRVGPFGFLVTGSSPNDITGNYGLMDSRLALKWVSENIRRFGGDNGKITISGQSVGACIVAIFLSSGKVDNLFSKAIMQSASFAMPLQTLDVAIEQGRCFANLAECLHEGTTNMTCLRSLSAERIVALQTNSEIIEFPDNFLRSGVPWLPHIDGDEVKLGFIEGFRDSVIPPKPIIIGTTTDEGLLFVLRAFREPLNHFAGKFVAGLLLPNIPAGIWSLYPVDDYSDTREELQEMMTDSQWVCPARLIARELSSRMPVYSYTFDQPIYFHEAFPDDPYCIGRTCHGADTPFVFQSAGSVPFDEVELALSDKIVSYWTNFAKYGNPNLDMVNGTKWLRYKMKGNDKESTIVLKAEGPALSHVKGYRSKFCDAWDTSGYQ